MTSKPISIPHKTIGVGVLWNAQQQILIDRRRPEGAMGGLWEFPGGKLEPGETVEECIRRELMEELGVEVDVGDRLITIEHDYSHLRVTLAVHHCHYLSGVPQPIECAEIRWVTLDEIEQYNFPAANVQIIAAIKDYK
ncbi:8-oxo-dGTP diphosphatase MutT [Chroococcidiopsis sp. FACHB-1243]|uniref:8-oxo-dGTP diphosphatase MutT n=1 Tax=Chroococcidiopsis sp. [FACHB-1243] TaxID=2692781 RepID=UPI001786EAC8|nr:8-oxo-dGTP diphosphatase MutT [Chroococcidiopsis sp. [FACHB-1243]]MBD2306674.1 8-oxo-dGTP diphosphatase MutT [Chroococcidiopsis sp. [FACHB-1243]]